METSSAPAIPLVSGWREGQQSLWCVICDQTWPLPTDDDEKATEAARVMNLGMDHLETVHNRTPPLYAE